MNKSSIILQSLLQSVPHRFLASELARRQNAKTDRNLRAHYRAVSKAVAVHYNIDLKNMLSQSRRAEYTWPRYAVMHVLRELGWGLEAIRDVFGYASHQTIMHGLRSHMIRSRTDTAYLQFTESVLAKFQPSSK